MDGRGYYFILSGENPSLAQGELEALLEVAGYHGLPLYVYSGIAVTASIADLPVEAIVGRAAYIRSGGVFLGFHERGRIEAVVRSAAEELGEARLRVYAPHGHLGPDERKRYTRRLIELLGNHADLGARHSIDIVFVSPEAAAVGIALADQPRREYHARRPSTRPFFRSIALSVRLSRAMLNLARLRPGDTVLDPFAGTGSIVIEACYMGMRSIGVDVDWRLVTGCNENTAYYGLPCGCILSDSVEYVYAGELDAVVTDPPYGTGASTHGRSLEEVYRGFLANAARVVAARGYIVFLAPHYARRTVDKLVCRAGLIPIRRYSFYVHNRLTRLVYVVYRP